MKVKFHISYGDSGYPLIMILDAKTGIVQEKGPEIVTDEDMIREIEHVKNEFTDRDFSIPRMEHELVVYRRKAKPKKKT